MTKPTITKTWIAGVIVMAAGLVIGGISLGLMFAYGGTFIQQTANNYVFEPNFDAFFWTTVGVMILGFAIAVAGGIVQFVAWIGALTNTYLLQDKTWFVVLLAGGLLGLAFGLIGLATMIAYLIAGPDGKAAGMVQGQGPAAPPPGTLAPTT
jgi:hypothetical protein